MDERDVRVASRVLAASDVAVRLNALSAFARTLREREDQILAANGRDLARAHEDADFPKALADRLKLTPERLSDIAASVEAIAALPEVVGEVIESRTLDNGLALRRVRVPFGVVCVVFEARPNVAADAAAIALKTANAIILRGSSTAVESNCAIVACLHAAIAEVGLPEAVVWSLDPADRDEFLRVVAIPGAVDVVIPRGGERLKHLLLEHSAAPVLAAAGGNCHVYIDAAANLQMAVDIVVNAKTSRPGVCNAAETVLVHEARTDDVLPVLRTALTSRGVEIREGIDAWRTEFLDLQIGLRIVDSLDTAIAHIASYGTAHSEAIITEDAGAAERFCREVDAAAIYVNASTRFTDGGVFGMGAEVGISTSKLHARGPIGPRELTTSKYILEGHGQIRA